MNRMKVNMVKMQVLENNKIDSISQIKVRYGTFSDLPLLSKKA